MFNVEVTAQASDEAEEAYLWMKENSPEAAADWFDGLVEKANSLANFPKRCALACLSPNPLFLWATFRGRYRYGIDAYAGDAYALRAVAGIVGQNHGRAAARIHGRRKDDVYDATALGLNLFACAGVVAQGKILLVVAVYDYAVDIEFLLARIGNRKPLRFTRFFNHLLAEIQRGRIDRNRGRHLWRRLSLAVGFIGVLRQYKAS
jgi:plasmid stabilization system protein ParE